LDREVLLREELSKLDLARLKNPRPVCLRSVDSTQDYLIKVLQSSSQGEFVVSEVQTNGKGREGRKWFSDYGGLYLSLTLTPERIEVLERIPMLITQAILDTLELDFHLGGCNTKLPNDVICRTKKIAGVLVDVEVKGKKAIAYAGMGIDLNNGENWTEAMLKIATSYFLETGEKLDLDQFIVRLFSQLDKRYDRALRN
jgi:BirA family biotin operon repressor/biotin-[acetyl-CoA-carboxylase] ligase